MKFNYNTFKCLNWFDHSSYIIHRNRNRNKTPIFIEPSSRPNGKGGLMDGILISLSQPYWICFSNCHVANHHFLQEFTFWKGTTNLRRVSMDPSMFFLCWDGSSRQNLGKNFFFAILLSHHSFNRYFLCFRWMKMSDPYECHAVYLYLYQQSKSRD